MDREYDPATAHAFAGRLVTTLNESFLALALSIGHRTGLFDVMARLPAKTSAEIATAAGLQERYVREWLGAMVCGGVVDHDGRAGTYRLPPEHAQFLTRDAKTKNAAFAMQYVSALALVEDAVVRCFKESGGVPPAAYDRLLALQAEESALRFEETLLSRILPLVPAVAHLEAGGDVLDLGGGRGRVVNRLAQAFPRSRFLGFDLSASAVAAARTEAERLGLSNARHLILDVAELQDAGAYDLVTAWGTLHDQAEPARVLRNCWRALRPGGVFLCMDIAASSHLADNVEHPFGPMLYTRSTMHAVPVSLSRDGAGLGCVWGEERARRMLIEAGFTNVTSRKIEGDPLHLIHLAERARAERNQ